MRLKNDEIILTFFIDLASTNKIFTNINVEDIFNLRKNFKISKRQITMKERCLLIMTLTKFCCNDDVRKMITNFLLKI